MDLPPPPEQLCPLCGKPSPGGVAQAHHIPQPARPVDKGWQPTKGVTIGLIVGGLIVAGALSTLTSGDDTGSSFDSPGVGSSTHRVRYVVTGDARQADVTYQNVNADTSQESEVSVPWDYSFIGDEGAFVGAFVYISAQRGGSEGDITCEIEVDGVTVEANTSSGPYTICTASGSL